MKNNVLKKILIFATCFSMLSGNLCSIVSAEDFLADTFVIVEEQSNDIETEGNIVVNDSDEDDNILLDVAKEAYVDSVLNEDSDIDEKLDLDDDLYSYVEADSTGVGGQYRTQNDILNYIATHYTGVNIRPTYKTEPDYDGKQFIGELSSESTSTALNMLNIVRYIAGLNDVTISDDYTQKAQASSFILLLKSLENGEPYIDHTPEKPAGVSDEIYRLGYRGSGESNLAWASSLKESIPYTVLHGWMADYDSLNISALGHRRWLINPSLSQVGFGFSDKTGVGSITTVHCFDTNGTDTSKGIAWPARTMPVDFFNSRYPWSYTVGETVDQSSVKVVLKRQKDDKTWTFPDSSKSYDPRDDYSYYFGVNNGGYGQTGCIIFRPDSLYGYADGDIFDVEITYNGGKKINYSVDFFKINGYSVTYQLGMPNGKTPVNHPDNPTTINKNSPTYVLKAPTCEDHTFLGWYEQGKPNVEVKEIPAGTTRNITLVAKWAWSGKLSDTVEWRYYIYGEFTLEILGEGSLKLPDTMKEVPWLSRSAAIKKYIIGDKITDVDIHALFDSKYVENFVVSDKNPYITYKDGIFYSKDMKKIMAVTKQFKGDGSLNYDVPDTITEISDTAFDVMPYVTLRSSSAYVEKYAKDHKLRFVKTSSKPDNPVDPVPPTPAPVVIDDTVFEPIIYAMENDLPIANNEITDKSLIFVETKTDGANIYYTLDGSDPIPENANKDGKTFVYNNNISIKNSISQDVDDFEVKAIAIKENFKDSNVVSSKFHILKDDNFGDIIEEDQKLFKSPKDVQNILWVAGVSDVQYTGRAITFDYMRVYMHKKLLRNNVDYTVKYKNNKNAGIGTVIVTGKGYYKGIFTKEFNINKLDLASLSNIKVNDIELKNNGKLQKGKPDISYVLSDGTCVRLSMGRDYTCEYPKTDKKLEDYDSSAFTDNGTYSIIVTAKEKSNFIGTLKVKEVISDDGPSYIVKDIKKCEIDINTDVIYKGDFISPIVKIIDPETDKTLKPDVDYTVCYLNNLNASKKATIEINGIGKYKGLYKKVFTINPVAITKDNIIIEAPVIYENGGVVPSVTVKSKINGKDMILSLGVDYTVQYRNNKSAVISGTNKPTVKVTGKGNYTGIVEKEFTISKGKLQNSLIYANDVVNKNKSGSYKSQITLVDVNGKKLSAGKDYDRNIVYTYESDTTVKYGRFSIPIKRDRGCEVQKDDLIPSGTKIRATVNEISTGNYTGTNYVIYSVIDADKAKFDISKATVQIASKEYSGLGVRPAKDAFTFKLPKGSLDATDYDIALYANNINTGKGVVVIAGKGEYCGYKIAQFNITSKIINNN